MLNPRTPDLITLTMLCAVRRHGSFSLAGNSLSVSQQAISSRMRALEESLGLKLLHRSAGGSSLTATGGLIADWAEDVLAAADRLDAGIASVRAEGSERLHVVASQTIAEHLLPQWLVILRQHQQSTGITPTIVELTVGNSTTATALVRAGDAALGFIETPLIPKDLAVTTIGFDELVVAVAPTHPWAHRRTPLTGKELAGTALITREPGSGTRDALEAILAAAFPEIAALSPVVELTTTAAVRSAITSGSAPGVLSTLAVRDDLTLGRLIAVPLLHISLRRPLSAIWRIDNPLHRGPQHALVTIAGQRLP